MDADSVLPVVAQIALTVVTPADNENHSTEFGNIRMCDVVAATPLTNDNEIQLLPSLTKRTFAPDCPIIGARVNVVAVIPTATEQALRPAAVVVGLNWSMFIVKPY